MEKGILLKEIKPVLRGDVDIFEDAREKTPEGSWFCSLFEGDSFHIPGNLMDRKVVHMFGGSTGILEINVEREDA